MQVVLQTPTELVVHDGRLSTVLMGALFTASGGGFMWLRWTHPQGWSGNGGPWLVYVVGTMFVLAGLFLFWISADRRYIVDRASKTITIVAQRLVHRTTTVVPFNDIDDIALEQSAGIQTRPSEQTSPTWRVVLLMKDGSRLPWTPYSTSARKSQETCAAAARAFGGWSGNPEHAIPPTTATPALISHPVATNWGCLAAFFSIFFAVGIGLFVQEVYRMAVWRPVTATVVSSNVGSVRGDKGTSYKPVVVYDYTYEGNPYQGAAVTPIDISSSEAWARSIGDRYRPGDVTTAYVNPKNPYDAFLLRRVSMIPLIFVAMPVFLGLLFGWIIRVQRAQVQFAQKHLVPVVNSI